jgi:hypothetical protein
LGIPLSYIDDRQMPPKKSEGGRVLRQLPGGLQPSITEAVGLGSGVGFDATLTRSRIGQQQADTAAQQRDQTIKLLVAQIAAEGQLTLTAEKRVLAERLILETALSVCEVLAKEQDQQRR